MTDTESRQETKADRLDSIAQEIELDESRQTPDRVLKKTAKARQRLNICPECQHVFQGNGWDGIDAHWKAKHDHILPYADAWPLIKSGKYFDKK